MTLLKFTCINSSLQFNEVCNYHQALKKYKTHQIQGLNNLARVTQQM